MILNKTFVSLVVFFICSLMLSVLIYSLCFTLIKADNTVEKLTPYECGFNPYSDARRVFDVRFYLVAIFFIIFDLEIVFLFPWVITLTETNSLGFWTMIEFLIELVVGFAYVWLIGALNWHK